MIRLLQILISAAALAILSTCSPPPSLGPAATQPPTAQVPGAPVPTSPNHSAPPPGANPTLSSGSLWLNILSPQDQAIVNVAQVELVGQAPAGTVISVNDQILIVGAEGQFVTAISLVEGPNVIEIIASDAQGNEIDTSLSVFFQP